LGVVESGKRLLIGSTETYSGKSSIILGIANQLKHQGLKLAYGKPVGTCLSSSQLNLDDDVLFIAQVLELSEQEVRPTLLFLDPPTIAKRIAGEDQTQYRTQLQEVCQPEAVDLLLLEGAGTLEEGRLFDLSLPQIAEAIDAQVMLVTRFHSDLVVDALLSARQQLGDRLCGVVINDIPPDRLDTVSTKVIPFLEQQGIPVLGLLPRHSLLRSVSVGEIVHRLNAQVLSGGERLDLRVESLKIGAMNVNAALKYFRRTHNMAVVTGGDRTDIQLAALETSTQCLILTGQIAPSKDVLRRAEDLEIPILSVDLDTLTTVEIIDQTFGQVRLCEAIKVQCVYQLMAEHFAFDRLMRQLGLKVSKGA
jgi:hypothetical protein